MFQDTYVNEDPDIIAMLEDTDDVTPVPVMVPMFQAIDEVTPGSDM